MSAASIALNRFGYGLALGEQPPRDPPRFLLQQLDAFDPSPRPIAARAATRGKSGEMLQLLRGLRERARDMADPAMVETGMAGMMVETGETNPPAALAGLPPEYRQKLFEARRVVVDDLSVLVNVAVASPTPLVERLVHFWSNHFSVSVGKPGTQFEVGPQEFHAIRPHVLGRFSDMLKAAVLHPAMLLYLDQFQSTGPGSPFQQRRGRRANQQGGRGGLNENLAREVLELHTLGVGGGYSQDDVTELARALTGWTVPGIGRVGRFAEDQATGAAFVALAHEPGERTILGHRYPAGGPKQALAVLDDLAAHPATARFVATKLARHFAGDTPSASLVTRLEEDFRKTGGDLASLTRTLIASPEAWVPGPVKFRAPFEWFIAAARLTGIAGLEPPRIARVLNELGQSPWRAPSPAGYDDLAASWAAPDMLLRRAELAERMVKTLPADDVLTRAQAAFPDALSDPTREWLTRAESGRQALALLLVAPEMMRR